LLSWTDVDWENGRLNVRSPKTEHHPGHERRTVPIIPKLMKLLTEALQAAPEGQGRIVTVQPGGYLNRMMIAYIKRAHIKPWARLWQTLRSSCEKEWAMTFPQFAESKWIGHSITVSGKHYANDVPHELFAKAAACPHEGFEPIGVSADSGNAAQTDSQQAPQNPPQTGAKQAEMIEPEKQKSPEFPGFSAALRAIPIGATRPAPW
jgi:hypothetical protein